MIEATEIMPRLFVGSRPNPGPEVADAGFDTLVLCALPSEYRLVYKLRPGANLGACFPGVRHAILVALDDKFSRPPTPEELRRATAAALEVAQAIRGQRRVLVTCMQGRNRSALVAALALRDLCGWSSLQAMARLRLRRQIEGGMLTNPQFVAYLESLPVPVAAVQVQKPALRLVR